MTLSVIRYGSAFGIWDSDLSEISPGIYADVKFIYGPKPQSECFDKKREMEDSLRELQDNEFKMELRERYMTQLLASGMPGDVAMKRLREVMPNIFAKTTIEGGTGRLFDK